MHHTISLICIMLLVCGCQKTRNLTVGDIGTPQLQDALESSNGILVLTDGSTHKARSVYLERDSIYYRQPGEQHVNSAAVDRIRSFTRVDRGGGILGGLVTGTVVGGLGSYLVADDAGFGEETILSFGTVTGAVAGGGIGAAIGRRQTYIFPSAQSDH